MKTWKIVLITFWVIAALILTLLLTVLLTDNPWSESLGEFFSWRGNFNIGGFSSRWGSSFNGTEIDGEVSLSANDVDSIKVNWLDGQVDVHYHDANTVRLYQTSNDGGEIPEDRKLVYNISGGLLNMREGKDRVISSRVSTNLLIYLPQGMSLDMLEISGVSTDISAWNLTTDELKLNSVSGSQTLYSVTVDGTLKADAVSGRMEFSSTSASYLDMNSVSGSQTAAGAFDAINANTVSGGIDVRTTIMPEEAEFDTVSGSITLAIPSENSGFTAKYSKVSGSFSCDFATMQEKNRVVYGDGSVDIEFDTVSGSMRIEKIK